ncbi:MAG: DNA repair protein RadA [Magnetococcales bacterium]|nr:DNA repair protein RadA [Magnetococcales bacterium]
MCSECGGEHPRWQGRCTACGAWNTLREMKEPAAGRKGGGGAPRAPFSASPKPVPLSEIRGEAGQRLLSGIGELDRALGGGLVPGSAVLLAGDPGIGKSTLLLEAMSRLSREGPVLYVSGEESPQQLKMRAERTGVSGEALWVLGENRLEAVLEAVEENPPLVLAVDSIQTLAGDFLPAAPGTVAQVRECAAALIVEAKRRGMPLFLVGHVTKEGQIAGPKLLEHMVDAVLYFEGERGHNYRILRAVKNRFGPANEIGVFEMGDEGLREVTNPSELFLSQRSAGCAGSVVFAGMEGTRPLMVEIQSLVAPSPLAQPRRTTIGFDGNRLALLAAVLEKRLGVGLFDQDVFLNVAGGLKLTEPAADLAVAVSLFAARRNLTVDPGLVITGEVGLGGEVRAISHPLPRLKEAAKLGFARCMLPAASLRHLPGTPPLTLVPVATVREAMEKLLETRPE